jgi:hypothetical protein
MRISRMIINYVKIESVCETLEVAVKVNTKKPRLSWFKYVQCRFSIGKHWRQAEKKLAGEDAMATNFTKNWISLNRRNGFIYQSPIWSRHIALS